MNKNLLPTKLKFYYKTELYKSKECWNTQNLLDSWKHLERAHIIAQPYPIEHTAVHWKMLLFGIKIKST